MIPRTPRRRWLPFFSVFFLAACPAPPKPAHRSNHSDTAQGAGLESLTLVPALTQGGEGRRGRAGGNASHVGSDGVPHNLGESRPAGYQFNPAGRPQPARLGHTRTPHQGATRILGVPPQGGGQGGRGDPGRGPVAPTLVPVFSARERSACFSLNSPPPPPRARCPRPPTRQLTAGESTNAGILDEAQVALVNQLQRGLCSVASEG